LSIASALPKKSTCTAHCGEVDEQRHAGEILQHNARHEERHLRRAVGIRLPRSEFAHIFLGDFFSIHVTKDGFEHNAQARGQAGNFTKTSGFQRGQ
jgi:hypothetical protein